MSPPAARGIVLATRNAGKLREVRAILGDLGAAILSLDELPPVELPEEGDDYEANALAKSRAVARALGRAALADDSGLEVEALGGAPGPRSARYGGPGLDDAARNALLLRALEGVPAARRGARFVCVAALVTPEGGVLCARGECAGRILGAPRGAGGFGYDPIFEVEGGQRTMAELAPWEKDHVSHRARAFRALRDAVAAAQEPLRS